MPGTERHALSGHSEPLWDLEQETIELCFRAQLPLDFERPVERLIRSGELHIGLRDVDDDVLIVEVKTPRLELDVNFEIRAVLTDKCFS